jgi:PAS domain-containing protein
MEELHGWGWTDFAHPDDVTAFADKWRACLRKGECFEAEARVRRADGQFRWVWMRNVPLRDPSCRGFWGFKSHQPFEQSSHPSYSLRPKKARFASRQLAGRPSGGSRPNRGLVAL